MRSLVLIVITLLAAAAGAAGLLREKDNARTHPHATADAAIQHVIVKLRPASTAAGAGTGTTTALAKTAVPSAERRLAAVTSRTGVTLDEHRAITEHAFVMRAVPVGGESVAQTLERLRADPDVEYAELDQRRYIHAVTPNDALYTQQWYLQAASSSQPSATDATDAWSTSEGASTLVIADIDTGVRTDHPDLAGRLLPGYCFISDSFVANGGTCPGAGAVDPGDWITSADVTGSPQGECKGASAEPSSWHGTRVAGVLGAATNDSIGVAGVTWNGQLLPVRALGKCGGQDSDIIQAMLWAGGISVTGAPVNTHPAKIINMSLGGTGSCPASYQDAINQLTAIGVLIVVSAGNEEGLAVDAPANCSGVAGIAGLRQAGTKVGFSNIGPEVALSAPAGNCVNTGAEQPCLYTLATTTNLGYQQPDVNDYTGEYYCDATTGSYAGCTLANANQYRTYNLGTSFSAPIVSGIAALMASVNSNLSSCQLIARLKEGSQTFPTTSSDNPAVCTVPTASSPVQNECVCTTSTCGAGMASAMGALTAALRPIAAVSLPASPSAGATVTLDGSGSAAANNHTVSSYQWSAVSGTAVTLGSTSAAKATLTMPSCGVATVQLLVTDDGGRTDSANVVATPGSLTSTAPSTAAQTSCTSGTATIVVGICPATSSVQVGGGTASFTATVANTTTSSVSWEVNGIAGGNATVGTISTNGVYAAPTTVPATGAVTVTAVSTADGTASASSTVTLTTPAGKSGGGGLDWLALAVLGTLAGFRLSLRASPLRGRPSGARRR